MESANTHPAGKRELLYFLFSGLCALFLANMTIFGGFHLGFAIAASLSLLCASLYLILSGCRPKGYPLTVLGLCLVIAASFARSDDAFVKFVMVCFLLVGSNLGLCLLAGKNCRDSGTAASLADAGFALFQLGVGELPASTRGLTKAFRESGAIGQKGGAVLLGLGISIPVLLLIVPLLMAADAAFEGLLDLLPEFSVSEFLSTLIVGFVLAFLLYTRGTALRFYQDTVRHRAPRKGLAPLTVNTLLTSVVFVYGVYLVSQLAYFAGGFSGILPEEYTLAQYARRGFFEMGALCALNLGIMVFSLSLCRETAPKSTRILCLLIGIVTLFLVVTASAKMILYIAGYGLTRLRVLTQVIMVFMALVTVLVSIWLFLPKLPYMKVIVIAALIMGAAVSWADVDTQVAKYNTDAYLSGRMQEIDMAHMGSLGQGAMPYIARLSQEARDPMTRGMAEDLVNHSGYRAAEDFRSWNYVNYIAGKYAPEEEVPEGSADEIYSDSKFPAVCVIIGMEGVSDLEVSGPTSSGGCVHADGSLFEKGEKVWLSEADRLQGLTVTARNRAGEILWQQTVPEDLGVTSVSDGEWVIYLER